MPRCAISRREGEAIQISDDIFVEIKGSQVRLSIVAPSEVRILSYELVPEKPRTLFSGNH